MKPNEIRDDIDFTVWDVLAIMVTVNVFIGLVFFVLSFLPRSEKKEYTCAQFKRAAEINPQLYINTFMTDVAMRCQDSM